MTLRSLQNTQLWVEDSAPGGSTDRPTVVFSHGLLFRTALFAPQVERLRDRFRCVAYDHRGQGRSADSELRSIPMELLYQDAVALIESLGAAPVHFVGLSMGGFVGMRLAARRPDLIRSLVLLETSADVEPQENVSRYHAMNLAVRAVGVAPVASRVMPILFGRSSLSDASRGEEQRRWREMLLANRKSIWRAVNGVIDRVAVYPELGRIACPTLIAVGDEDVATVPAKAERIQRAIAHSKLETVKRAGHSSTLEQPALVNALIESHLAEHAKRPS